MGKKTKKTKKTKSNTLNMTKLLQEMTGKKHWECIDGPDSHVGVDHWFRSGNTEAHINIDHDAVTVCLNGHQTKYFTYQEACDYKNEGEEF